MTPTPTTPTRNIGPAFVFADRNINCSPLLPSVDLELNRRPDSPGVYAPYLHLARLGAGGDKAGDSYPNTF
jgi:hypothetical protein